MVYNEMVTVRLDGELVDEIDEYAERADVSRAEILRGFVEYGLETTNLEWQDDVE
jgi:metal-responsive CopG/Arc/MetJ family transcriptional regulator